MNEKVHLEAVYPASMERVWQALTDPAFLSRWLMPSDFQPTIGYKFTFSSGSLSVKGEVLDSDGKSKLTYTWDDGGSEQPSIVTWHLTPDGDGTRLTMNHIQLESYVFTEAQMNWNQASARLHGILIPIVYCDEPEAIPVLAQAGFRQPK